MADVHQALANAAFTKSGASGLYDRARPTYPSSAIIRILSHLPNHDAEVVELGSGTGIFSRGLLSSAVPGQIAAWRALEPAVGMREGFMRWASNFEGGTKITCTDGTFDHMESIESASADMVVAAQAWHWTGSCPIFQNKAMKEVERVLKPGGCFVLIWNIKDREVSNWVGAIRDAYEVHESGTPQYRLGLWKTLFQTPTFRNAFKLLPPDETPNSPQAREVKNVDDSIDASVPTLNICTRVPMTLEGLFDRILSKSYITALDAQTQELLRTKLQSVWNDHAARDSGLEWVDDKTVQFPYATHVYIMQKK
ncbi:hypothetical protein CROQUDRAFT_656557 [Cronartium quercuum f. sp. fusiforme G11]|uniref:Methyltransferase type 11 domain-containing protein n=1 Tax=Cronartium quercuum f. sp. fusiforme G11 TaxID=708437 RepID=A0A9P6TCW8_9BASI|nr:hypothetical protein CROQUDRAFT_656557 [Cronartium quercuum f. sp. fusiforme G11]